MTTVNKSFTAVGAGIALLVRAKRSFTYSLSGTFAGTAVLETSHNGGETWNTILTKTAGVTGTLAFDHRDTYVRWRCSAFTSGTLVTQVADVAAVLDELRDVNGALIFQVTESGIQTAIRKSLSRITPAALGKVGATSGWVPQGTTDVSTATLPASKTASTLVVPITGLRIGQTITGFNLLGSIGSVGGAVTLDADLRAQTAAVAGPVDASLGTITQVAVTANTLVDATNSTKVLATPYVVTGEENLYVLIHGTTAASTTQTLQAVAIIADDN